MIREQIGETDKHSKIELWRGCHRPGNAGLDAVALEISVEVVTLER